MGYEPIECGKAGLIALAGGKKEGKVFLIRGDMDALPIKEESDVEFSCQSGKMHACGHDMHTSMMLGAARLLKKHEDEIEGTVKLMFQPAEEIFEGFIYVLLSKFFFWVILLFYHIHKFKSFLKIWVNRLIISN